MDYLIKHIVTFTYPFPLGTNLMQIADVVFEQSAGNGLCFERNGRVYVALERRLVKYGVESSPLMKHFLAPVAELRRSAIDSIYQR